MRENRLHGSEGGEGFGLSRPLSSAFIGLHRDADTGQEVEILIGLLENIGKAVVTWVFSCVSLVPWLGS